MIYYSNKLKKENHMNISIDALKVFDKIQRAFRLKILWKDDIYVFSLFLH